MKYSLKEKIRPLKASNSVFERTFYFSTLIIWRFSSVPYRFIFNPEYRSLLWLKYFKNHGTHQISNFTLRNRYPYLFSACRQLVIERKELKILSYGCSTGEEVFTLRDYFPDAHIVGVDINKTNIKKANQKNCDSNIHFSHKIADTLSKHGPFDIIFALAVFQRTENRNPDTFDSSKFYPFEKFNDKIIELDTHLKAEGIFIIDHADYFFEDSDIYSSYHPLENEEKIIRNRPRFTKQNQRITEPFSYNRIFIKHRNG